MPFGHGSQRTLAGFKHRIRGATVTGARAGITERELFILRWTAEQYALPMAVVAELVLAHCQVSPLDRRQPVSPSSAPRLASRIAGRLEQLGYAGRRHAVGRWWLVPTRTGLCGPPGWTTGRGTWPRMNGA